MIHETLADVEQMARPYVGQGQVARYIPALARVSIDRFGVAVRTLDGETELAGDAEVAFSIQSISKLFMLTLALGVRGRRLWEHVGREPSGDPFNSLIQLEHESGRPRNPLINAGALCVTDAVISEVGDAKEAIRSFVSARCGEEIQFDPEVARSERDTGHRNVALAHFIKSFGRLENDVEPVLDAYFHQCSLAMSARQLATAVGYLANDGRCPVTGDQVLSPRRARRVRALMLTCGLYDAAGEFAFRVGLPAKSGVGGGIVAVVPGRLGVCAWSPGLDDTGNSIAAWRALEALVSLRGLTVF
jgi:glutaminase